MADSVDEHVILLHGLLRGPRSMRPLERTLRAAEFSVDNRAYPSRKDPIGRLASAALGAACADERARAARRVHFVTHSMGGILVRFWLSGHRLPNLGRVVMLAPPNQGSEIVDRIGGWKAFEWLTGPAGRELGTGADSVPNRLGPVGFPLGVIAGDRSVKFMNRLLTLPRPGDGRVTVARTRIEGMSDHLVVHATHLMIMRNPEVIRQTICFLREGGFDRAAEKA